VSWNQLVALTQTGRLSSHRPHPGNLLRAS
jgi:hypothetical protein